MSAQKFPHNRARKSGEKQKQAIRLTPGPLIHFQTTLAECLVGNVLMEFKLLK